MHKKNNLSGYYYCESSIIIEAIKPQEVKTSISDPKEEAYEMQKDTLASTSCNSTSSVEKDADKITLDITNTAAVNKGKGIEGNDEQPEAANIILGEKSYVHLAPNIFLAESTAADSRPEMYKTDTHKFSAKEMSA